MDEEKLTAQDPSAAPALRSSVEQAVISEKPKLLHELDWTRRIRKFPLARKSDPKIIRIAEVCRYTILKDACGRYNIVPSNSRSRGPCWFDLDPITAQAVLIDLQQKALAHVVQPEDHDKALRLQRPDMSQQTPSRSSDPDLTFRQKPLRHSAFQGTLKPMTPHQERNI